MNSEIQSATRDILISELQSCLVRLMTLHVNEPHIVESIQYVLSKTPDDYTSELDRLKAVEEDFKNLLHLVHSREEPRNRAGAAAAEIEKRNLELGPLGPYNEFETCRTIMFHVAQPYEIEIDALNARVETLEKENKEQTKIITEYKEKLDYVDSIGIRFGMMKTTDKPHPYLAHYWDENSTFQRMFDEWTDSIGWEDKLDKANKRAEEAEARVNYMEDLLDASINNRNDLAESLTNTHSKTQRA